MPTGPSTSQSPYVVGSEPNVTFTSLLSVGDTIGGYTMVGIADGLGAYDNSDGTVTVLMNHELPATDGVVRDHGSVGAFVSELIVDKSTLEVVSAGDLIQDVFLWDTVTDSYVEGTTAFNRFCSSDLAEPNAFFNAASGMGTEERIYLTGEEAGPTGRGFAVVATGDEKGEAYELPWMGKFAFENMLAAPASGDKTVVIATDDSTPGQVYMYVGDKSDSGTTVEKAGLTRGELFGIKVAGLTIENNTTTIPGGEAAFTLEALGDVSEETGAQLEIDSDTAGVTEFFRPEDGAWDPTNPNWFYFVTTGDINSNSRLYRMEFTDIANPTAGGTIKLLLEGDEGQRMMDNMDVTDEGKVIIQEDPGNNPRLAKIWQYDPTTDTLSEVAAHDPARFGTPPTAPFTQDEESSGVIDVTHLFGDADHKAYLVDVQAHYSTGSLETVQGGQLMLMRVEIPRDGDRDANEINAGFDADTLNGKGGDDTMRGGSNADQLKAGQGDDLVEGGTGADVLLGLRGNDTLDGSDGHDALLGDGGDDSLLGGLGDDKLFGDFGNDTMGGGAGEDVFKFSGGADLGDDIIVDFEQGADLIRLKNTGDAAFSDLEIANDVNGDAVITLGNGTTITLENIAAEDLRASDFFFV